MDRVNERSIDRQGKIYRQRRVDGQNDGEE